MAYFGKEPFVVAQQDNIFFYNVVLSSFSAVEVKIYLNLAIIYWHKLSRLSPPLQAQVNVRQARNCLD